MASIRWRLSLCRSGQAADRAVWLVRLAYPFPAGISEEPANELPAAVPVMA